MRKKGLSSPVQENDCVQNAVKYMYRTNKPEEKSQKIILFQFAISWITGVPLNISNKKLKNSRSTHSSTYHLRKGYKYSLFCAIIYEATQETGHRKRSQLGDTSGKDAACHLWIVLLVVFQDGCTICSFPVNGGLPQSS